jgi:hypothetical protein
MKCFDDHICLHHQGLHQAKTDFAYIVKIDINTEYGGRDGLWNVGY